jgi:hypothetical protein
MTPWSVRLPFGNAITFAPGNANESKSAAKTIQGWRIMRRFYPENGRLLSEIFDPMAIDRASALNCYNFYSPRVTTLALDWRVTRF